MLIYVPVIPDKSFAATPNRHASAFYSCHFSFYAEVSLLEAIHSVNCMQDTYDRIAGLIDLIFSTRFRLPETLI